MPELDPGYAQRQAERLAAYDAAMAEAHADGHLTKAEIDRCQLCDDEGYRRPERSIVCDHQDRTATAARGRALVQAELDKIRQRKGGAA